MYMYIMLLYNTYTRTVQKARVHNKKYLFAEKTFMGQHSIAQCLLRSCGSMHSSISRF